MQTRAQYCSGRYNHTPLAPALCSARQDLRESPVGRDLTYDDISVKIVLAMRDRGKRIWTVGFSQ